MVSSSISRRRVGTEPSADPVRPKEAPLPTKFELVINLKTAKQIGETIPQSVLCGAEKIIKESHK